MGLRDLMKSCFLRRIGGLSAPVLLGIAMMQTGLPTTAAAETSTNLSVEQKKNPHGEVIRETFVDEEGNPVMADDTAYCYAEHRYNSFPCRVETTFHDLEGNHVNTAQGYATIKYKWSGVGLYLEKSYYDLDGNLVLCEDGYATEKYEYQGIRLKKIGYYDTEGNPVCKKGSWASMVNTIDTEKGYVIKVEYFDENGEYMLCEDGYAYVEREYNKNQKLKEGFYDTQGHLVYLSKVGYALYKVETDSRGRITEIAYYDEEGGRLNTSNGYARIVRTYTEESGSKPATETYYDANENMVNCKKGYARIEYEYDKGKREIGQRFYDANGEPVLSTDGYWRFEQKYTMFEKVGYKCYYDTEDNLVIVPSLG